MDLENRAGKADSVVLYDCDIVIIIGLNFSGVSSVGITIRVGKAIEAGTFARREVTNSSIGAVGILYNIRI